MARLFEVQRVKNVMVDLFQSTSDPFSLRSRTRSSPSTVPTWRHRYRRVDLAWYRNRGHSVSAKSLGQLALREVRRRPTRAWQASDEVTQVLREAILDGALRPPA